MRLLLALPLILLALFALLLGFARKDGQAPDSRLVGTVLAPFEVPLSSAPDQPFSSHLWRGKVIVLNAFASWCLPCAAEHPVLMRLAESGKAEIYGLAWKDKPEKIEAWLAGRGNPYRMVGIDEKGAATVALGLTGVPETFVIGPDGTIAWHYKSNLTDEIVSRDILPLIESLRKNAQ
jgi:cytochrome c biogenesis protein CcmG, thiol:disulfide interchange protein DsbE